MTLDIDSEVAHGVRGQPIHVVPTGAALGAEVHGINLKSFDDLEFATLKRAWHDHSVLLVRGQTLSDQELIAFSRRFGDLDWAPIQETGRRFVEGLPEIYIVSNVKVNGEPIGSLGDGEAVWHTDMSYLDVPPKASMLYALEVPPTGGNTSFCSMYAIYDALPASVEGAHRRTQDQARRHLQQRRLCAPGRHADRRSAAPRRAPCIRWSAPIPRPAGACSISAAAATPISIGLELAESEALLDELWSYVDRARNSPGSMSGGSAISCCGTTAAPCTAATRSTPSRRRIMHRTQVKGDARPV